MAIESLLHEVDREKFSGVADISSQSRTGTLVFRKGKCILVKFQNNRGDTGWDDVQNAGSDEVDAALSLLDEAQIDLALEFNKPCQILKSGKHVPAQACQRPAPSVSRGLFRSVPAQKYAAPVASPKSTVKSAHSHHHVPAPHTTAPNVPVHAPPLLHPSPPAQPIRYEDRNKNEPDESPEKDNDTSSFESDIDTLYSMDIDNVTEKIRNDCKTMIKQLDLEHLMER
ncbi:MAG: hypothetical protein WCB46_09670 [Methanoregula sp.]